MGCIDAFESGSAILSVDMGFVTHLLWEKFRSLPVLVQVPMGCAFQRLPIILEKHMKTSITLSTPAEIVTECLVAVVLDKGEKDKPVPFADASDPVQKTAAAVLASGDVTGKTFETTLVHTPGGLKAKRLLLLGGGKTKNFSPAELRKIAGAAARFLKSRGIREFTF